MLSNTSNRIFDGVITKYAEFLDRVIWIIKVCRSPLTARVSRAFLIHILAFVQSRPATPGMKVDGGRRASEASRVRTTECLIDPIVHSLAPPGPDPDFGDGTLVPIADFIMLSFSFFLVNI